MNLFDQLVSTALENQPELSSLKIVVEKELLHHDILRILNQNNLLKDLTFIGGTCLRCCYSGVRLSEDLDFTGGINFSRDQLEVMGSTLTQSLQNKYGLLVNITEPTQDKKNVDTWKISIETRPKRKDLPAQRINIDICKVNSYEKQPMLLLNSYGVDMGTSGLVIKAQSREEIYADKMLAFAFRPNKIKYRDLWDISWLHQQNLKPRFNLIPKKLKERNLNMNDFLNSYAERLHLLSKDPNQKKEFKKEMLRFLPPQQSQTIENNELWDFIVYLLGDLETQFRDYIKKN